LLIYWKLVGRDQSSISNHQPAIINQQSSLGGERQTSANARNYYLSVAQYLVTDLPPQ